MSTIPLRFKRMSPFGTPAPHFGSVGAACFDLYADRLLRREKPLSREVIFDLDNPEYSESRFFITDTSPSYATYGTGFAFEVPEGHVMLVFPRSSTGIKNHATLANSVGVIDSDYRGEVLLCFDLNHTDWLPTTTEDHTWKGSDSPGDRVAQAMIVPRPAFQLEEVDELSMTDRGTRGIGSTGR